jgi:hypothetical protein
MRRARVLDFRGNDGREIVILNRKRLANFRSGRLGRSAFRRFGRSQR